MAFWKWFHMYIFRKMFRCKYVYEIFVNRYLEKMFGFEYLGVNIWIKYFMDGCSAPNYVSLENAFGWNILWPQTFSAQNIHHHCYFGLHLLKSHSATKIMAIAWHWVIYIMYNIRRLFFLHSIMPEMKNLYPKYSTGKTSWRSPALTTMFHWKAMRESLSLSLSLYLSFLVRSCLLTTLIKCLKSHKSLGSLFESVL